MASFEIERVYERAAPKDGKRILVDRLWPNRTWQGNFGVRRT